MIDTFGEQSRTGLVFKKRKPMKAREGQLMALTRFVEMMNLFPVGRRVKHSSIIENHALADKPPVAPVEGL